MGRPWYKPSTYAANANATAPLACADREARCAAWAAVGECERNELYMAEQARGLHPISA